MAAPWSRQSAAGQAMKGRSGSNGAFKSGTKRLIYSTSARSARGLRLGPIGGPRCRQCGERKGPEREDNHPGP
jgi:hypothetical protein